MEKINNVVEFIKSNKKSIIWTIISLPFSLLLFSIIYHFTFEKIFSNNINKIVWESFWGNFILSVVLLTGGYSISKLIDWLNYTKISIRSKIYLTITTKSLIIIGGIFYLSMMFIRYYSSPIG